MNDATTPVEQLIDSLTLGHPEVTVERMQVTHVADDDNVWFVRLGTREVQFDCHPNGLPPFLVEGDDGERLHAPTVHQARTVIGRLLGIG